MISGSRTQSRFLLASLALAGVAALMWAISYYGSVRIPTLIHTPQAEISLQAAIRWAALIAFCGYCWKRGALTPWIAAGILIGAEIGHDFPVQAVKLQVLSAIFLRLVRCILAPLIFSTLVVGIAGHANLRQVGRMGVKALIYFEVVTTLALFIGLAAINISKAGVGVQAPPSTAAPPATQKQTATDLILHIFPENIAKSVAENQVLQVVVFSIIFGVALAQLDGKRRRPVLEFMEGFSETMFKFTNIVMLSAPIGVGGAIAYTVGTMGFGVLKNLGVLVLTLYAALIVFICCVLVPVALIAKVPVKGFFQAVTEPASIAFATASSEAALPRAMEAMVAFGVPRQMVAFVIPTGYSFNLDGSTLYVSLAAIFVAQAADIHLSFGQQLLMVFTLMLTSKGLAGIPRAALVVLLATADSFQLPTWPIFIILGVDQLMDMARTMINVVGNCLASAVIARWEGEFRKEAPTPAVLGAVSPDAVAQ